MLVYQRVTIVMNQLGQLGQAQHRQYGLLGWTSACCFAGLL